MNGSRQKTFLSMPGSTSDNLRDIQVRCSVSTIERMISPLITPSKGTCYSFFMFKCNWKRAGRRMRSEKATLSRAFISLPP